MKFCQFQLILIIVSSLIACIFVAMMSPSESFADIKRDLFRFRPLAGPMNNANIGGGKRYIMPQPGGWRAAIAAPAYCQDVNK